MPIGCPISSRRSANGPGGSWSLAIVAEFLGCGSWLGHLADAAVRGTNTAQLLIVAFYSLTTFFLLNEGFKKMISWVPQQAPGETDIEKLAGAVHEP